MEEDIKIVFHKEVTAEKIHNIQKRVDSAVIRYMAPYTPYKTGTLEKSATIHTVIGSGEIVQSTPYARYLYYGVVYGPNIPIMEGGELAGFYSPPVKYKTDRELQYDTTQHPKAGRLWFERMKADHKEDIIREVMEE